MALLVGELRSVLDLDREPVVRPEARDLDVSRPRIAEAAVVLECARAEYQKQAAS